MRLSCFASWGGGIRTPASRDQNPLPYRLATPHTISFVPSRKKRKDCDSPSPRIAKTARKIKRLEENSLYLHIATHREETAHEANSDAKHEESREYPEDIVDERTHEAGAFDETF